MVIMTHVRFHFNRLMSSLIFGIWASEPLPAWRTTEKAEPDRVDGHQAFESLSLLGALMFLLK